MLGKDYLEKANTASLNNVIAHECFEAMQRAVKTYNNHVKTWLFYLLDDLCKLCSGNEGLEIEICKDAAFTITCDMGACLIQNLLDCLNGNVANNLGLPILSPAVVISDAVSFEVPVNYGYPCVIKGDYIFNNTSVEDMLKNLNDAKQNLMLNDTEGRGTKLIFRIRENAIETCLAGVKMLQDNILTYMAYNTNIKTLIIETASTYKKVERKDTALFVSTKKEPALCTVYRTFCPNDGTTKAILVAHTVNLPANLDNHPTWTATLNSIIPLELYTDDAITLPHVVQDPSKVISNHLSAVKAVLKSSDVPDMAKWHLLAELPEVGDQLSSGISKLAKELAGDLLLLDTSIFPYTRLESIMKNCGIRIIEIDAYKKLKRWGIPVFDMEEFLNNKTCLTILFENSVFRHGVACLYKYITFGPDNPYEIRYVCDMHGNLFPIEDVCRVMGNFSAEELHSAMVEADVRAVVADNFCFLTQIKTLRKESTVVKETNVSSSYTSLRYKLLQLEQEGKTNYNTHDYVYEIHTPMMDVDYAVDPTTGKALTDWDEIFSAFTSQN